MSTKSTMKTKKDIEQEFKNIKFLHDNSSNTNNSLKNNTTTIYTNTLLNGSFKNTAIITIQSDLFIGFNHELFIPNNLSEFWMFYESHEQTHNILIDSRAINYIAYAILKYEDNILIYDVYSMQAISIYAFCSKFFNIQTNEITIGQIKQMFVMYLIMVIFVKSFDFEWNTLSIIKSIKMNDYKINTTNDTNLNILDVLIECCKVKSTSTIKTKHIQYIINQFQIYFSQSAYQSQTAPNNTINEWNIKNIQPYEFLVALTVLKNNNFQMACV